MPAGRLQSLVDGEPLLQAGASAFRSAPPAGGPRRVRAKRAKPRNRAREQCESASAAVE